MPPMAKPVPDDVFGASTFHGELRFSVARLFVKWTTASNGNEDDAGAASASPAASRRLPMDDTSLTAEAERADRLRVTRTGCASAAAGSATTAQGVSCSDMLLVHPKAGDVFDGT